MKYYRTLWEGEALYTSFTTGQIQEKLRERIVIIQAFDRKGLLHGNFKVAYVEEDGSVGLKLALSNRMSGSGVAVPWYECDDGPFRLATTTDLTLEGNPQVGDLDTPYTFPTEGQINIWTLRPFQSYQTWHYDRYWGGPVGKVFDPPLMEAISEVPTLPVKGMKFQIDGWGHASSTRIVRTMLYSVWHGVVEQKLYLKSSTLQCVKQEVQNNRCFDTFV